MPAKPTGEQLGRQIAALRQELGLTKAALRQSEARLKTVSSQTEELSLAAAAMIGLTDRQKVFDEISRAITRHSDYRRVIISLFKDERPYRDIIAHGGLAASQIARISAIDMHKDWYRSVFEKGIPVGRLSYYIPHTMKDILNQDATIYGQGPRPVDQEAWHPEDNLFVRMNDENGDIIGVISVDDSKSGVRPSDETVRPLEIFSSLISQIIILKRAQDERGRLEKQLIQSHKIEAIGRLTGGIAHDFNNILGIVIGNAELALEDLADGHPSRQSIAEILTACHRAKDVVRQLLSYSRRTEIKRHPISLAAVVKEALTLMRASIPSNVIINTEITAGVDTVLADPTQINQVMINLCANAAQALGSGGGALTVGLHTAPQAPPSRTAPGGCNAGGHIRLSVSDSGSGISEEHLEQVFDPYFTTKDVGHGTGLGLSVVKGIVENHGGAISVDSQPGRGTTFTIFFPLVDSPPDIQAPVAAPPPGGQGRILFVDDEAAIVSMARRMLHRLGYQATSFQNPIEALDAMRARPDHFDAVITDMTMPQMTGEQLMRQMLAIRPAIPVILCSGYSERIDRDKALALGAAQYLDKPIDKHRLAAALKAVLGPLTPQKVNATSASTP
jgi:signal transduction histidine kinase/ActR/RegA family two-component response regulator/uncharacterized protein YerC